MGLVINRPARDKTLGDLLADHLLSEGLKLPKDPIYAGGPAETERGFVLHSPDYADGAETMRIGDHFSMTASDRVFQDLLSGEGPTQRLIAVGYAGWGAGQLDAEMRDNAWFTVPAEPDLVFSGPDDAKWRSAIAALGIDAAALSGLSAQHGHA